METIRGDDEVRIVSGSEVAAIASLTTGASLMASGLVPKMNSSLWGVAMPRGVSERFVRVPSTGPNRQPIMHARASRPRLSGYRVEL